jgi:2-phosphoglycerate kinase
MGSSLKMPLEKGCLSRLSQRKLIQADDAQTAAQEIARRLVSEYGKELRRETAVYRVPENLRLKE